MAVQATPHKSTASATADWWSEKVNVLEDSLAVTRKRKRHIESALDDAERQALVLQHDIDQLEQRLQQQEQTVASHDELQRKLRHTLSKARSHLVQTVQDALSTTTTPVPLLGSDNPHETREAVHALLESSFRESAASESSIAEALEGTCLDFRLFSTKDDSAEKEAATKGSIEEDEADPKRHDNGHESGSSVADSNHDKLDPNVPLCPYELNGVCSDPHCTFQHLTPGRPAPERPPLPPLRLPRVRPTQKHKDNSPAARSNDHSSEAATATSSDGGGLDSDNDDEKDDPAAKHQPHRKVASKTTTELEAGSPARRQDGGNDDSGGGNVAGDGAVVVVTVSLDEFLVDREPLATAAAVETTIAQHTNDSKDDNAPAAILAPWLAAAVQRVRLEIHAGRLPVPQTCDECFDRLCLAAANRKMHDEDEDEDDDTALEDTKQRLQRAWEAAAGEMTCCNKNVFVQAFRVQRILGSLLLPPFQLEAGAALLDACADRAVLLCHLTDTVLPLVVSRAMEGRHRRSATTDFRAAVILGTGILQMLERVAIDEAEEEEASVIALGNNNNNRRGGQLVKVLDKLSATMDCWMIQHNKILSLQLLWAPIVAALLSLACHLRQDDAVQTRIEQLWHLSSLEQGNAFVYSELLWSQLVQLRLGWAAQQHRPTRGAPCATAASGEEEEQDPQSPNSPRAPAAAATTESVTRQRTEADVERLAKCIATLSVALRSFRPLPD